MTQPPSTRPPRTDLLGLIGEILLSLGLVLALFILYQVWWTDVLSAQDQRRADGELSERWQSAQDQPQDLRRRIVNLGTGDPFSRLYIPKFGGDYHRAVVVGTTDDALNTGPGYYPDTQLPGESGNFAVAGHRVGRGAPFNDLDALSTCDPLVVQTKNWWFIYRVLPLAQWRGDTGPSCLPNDIVGRLRTPEYRGVSGRSVVLPNRGDVLAPIPGRSDAPNDSMLALITLTTCHPPFSATERMIIHGVLVRSVERQTEPIPAELME